MKTLEWAAELSISEDEAKSRLGLSQLRALAASHLNDKDVQAFVDAALDAVVEDVVHEIEEAEGTDEPVAVVRIAGTTASTVGTLDAEPSLPSESRDEGGRRS